MPAVIVDRLNQEINAGLADPKLKARLADLGGTVIAGSPGDFAKFVADDAEKWAKVRLCNVALRTLSTEACELLGRSRRFGPPSLPRAGSGGSSRCEVRRHSTTPATARPPPLKACGYASPMSHVSKKTSPPTWVTRVSTTNSTIAANRFIEDPG